MGAPTRRRQDTRISKATGRHLRIWNGPGPRCAHAQTRLQPHLADFADPLNERITAGAIRSLKASRQLPAALKRVSPGRRAAGRSFRRAPR